MSLRDFVVKNTIHTPFFKSLQKTYHVFHDGKLMDIHPKIETNNCNMKAKNILFVLAGYKPFLWKSIFARLSTFAPKETEICIVSSGLYSKKLSSIAKKNSWAYIHTKKNNVSYALNTAISAFKNAEYIIKMDEDIFVTKDFGEKLLDSYEKIQSKGDYNPGILAPMLPINGFSHLLVLRRFGLEDEYEKRFEHPIFAAGANRQIESNPDTAKFFWGGEGSHIPHLDDMNRLVSKDPFSYEAAPVRFSIGLILFKRQLWQEMGMLQPGEGAGMGHDETQLCEYAVSSSRPIVISKNTICGHLSFGPQNNAMKQFFEEHPERFKIS